MSGTDLLTYFATNTWAIFVALLFFGASIFVHELGHFLAARRRGVRVERFSIGFGPKMFGWRGRDGVDYRVSWLPLGGYVALPQLADLGEIEGGSSSDVSALPPLSYTTKVLVFVAGAVFNVIFAFLLATVLWFVGQPAVQEEQTTRIGFVRPTVVNEKGEQVPGPAFAAGLRPGDVVLRVDGRAVRTHEDILQNVVLGSGRESSTNRRRVEIVYTRDGVEHTAQVFPELSGPESMRTIGLEAAAKVMVADVQSGSAAAEAGLKFRDVITEIDGQPVNYLAFISDYVQGVGGRPVTITYERDGQRLQTTFAPRRVEEAPGVFRYRLGVSLRPSFTISTIRTPPWTMIGQVVTRTWQTLSSLVSPHSDVRLSQMSGPIGIGNGLRTLATLDMRLVLWFVVLINVNLAIFNLLPIPVLDGGHILFATIAKLRGKALSMNFIATTQSIFMVLLFGLIIYVSFFDVRRIARDFRSDAQAREAAEQRQKEAEKAKAGETTSPEAPKP